jgi:hypothetical protein
MEPIPQPMFDIFALSLPRGHGFGDRRPVGAWGDGLTCGVVTQDAYDRSLGVLAMRRRVDHVWVVTAEEDGLATLDAAKARLKEVLRIGEPPEPLPRNTSPRPALYDLQDRTASDVFDVLRLPSHHRAAWVLNQLYLALPSPDKHWAADCQTKNFHARIWEAQLLAAFREQGLLVTQPFENPDFRIQNRRGGEAWVEAVTANPPVPYNHVNAPQSRPPEDRLDRFFGPAAVRFAKTLGNKLDRRYRELEHVQGKPFMIALADFQAAGSMLWSREGLIGYLYGEGAEDVDDNGHRVARPVSASVLHGPTAFPVGLFANDQHAELSAVIFSNACSIGKMNRVMVSAGADSKGHRYTRVGRFFDRTPGAIEGIPFCLDVAGAEYRRLWPQGCEPWSAEMEVFHNPFARHPAPYELLPEATHWFEQGGERVCRSFYETSILWSKTFIDDGDKPPRQLEDFLPRVSSDNVGGQSDVV